MLTELFLSLAGTLAGCLISVLTACLTAGKRRSQRQKASEDGLQCLLRQEIIATYEKWHHAGFCPLYVKESMKRMYSAYHKLGGNDIATGLYLEMMQMETNKEETEECDI